MYHSRKKKVAGRVWACLLTKRRAHYTDQTSRRILAWGGAEIIQRKTGLLAHKVTITKRGNFSMSRNY